MTHHGFGTAFAGAPPPVQPLPGLAEHAARELVDEQAVQVLHETVRVLGAHDERQVQVVGGLRHEMDLLLLEHLEHGRELVQDRADALADERDRRAVADDRDLAELAQIVGERLDGGAVRDVLRRVDRDRDVALGRRDQVDRDAVLAEDNRRRRRGSRPGATSPSIPSRRA